MRRWRASASPKYQVWQVQLLGLTVIWVIGWGSVTGIEEALGQVLDQSAGVALGLTYAVMVLGPLVAIGIAAGVGPPPRTELAAAYVELSLGTRSAGRMPDRAQPLAQ